MEVKESLKKFWAFLKKDSWPSFFVSLILAFIIIKFILFPGLSLVTGTQLPLVIVESCSMYHSQSLHKILENKIYEDYNVDVNNTGDWSFKRGFSKGDIIFVIVAKNVEVGDVIVFEAGQTNSIIHRVIQESDTSYTTKGDNNFALLPFEKTIPKQNVYGKAVFRIPYLGWIKLIFFDVFKPAEQRGFCR